VLPAGSLRQTEKTYYCAAGETITGVGAYAVVGSPLACPHSPLAEGRWAMSKLVRMVAAGSAMASSFRDRKARWHAWICC
jgi:hypothetical protein